MCLCTRETNILYVESGISEIQATEFSIACIHSKIWHLIEIYDDVLP